MKVLWLDWSTGIESVDQLQQGLTGGRVGALRELPDALWKLGIESTVWADIEHHGATAAGTQWVSKDNPDAILSQRWDALICMRGLHDGWPWINAKARILCVRDLPHMGWCKEPRLFNAVDRVVFLSRYAERVWRCYFKDIRKSVVIPNGVDRSVFYPREKRLDYLIFASAPNRGLMRLPLIFDMTRHALERDDITLKAFSHLGKLHPGEVKKDVYLDGYALDYALINESPMEWLDPVPKVQLAEELGAASLMLLPSTFPEICSNTVLQALASGCPVVTTGNIGSTPEWVRHDWNGWLTQFNPQDYCVFDIEMVRGIVRALENQNIHRKWIANAAKTPGIYTWEEVGLQWKRMLNRLL